MQRNCTHPPKKTQSASESHRSKLTAVRLSRCIRGITSLCSSAPRGSSCFPGELERCLFRKPSTAVSLVGHCLCFTASEESRGSNLWPRDSLGRRQHCLQVQPGKILMERLTGPRIRDRIWINAETGNSTPREGPFRELSVGARKRADAGEYLPEQDAERADFRPSRPSRVRP